MIISIVEEMSEKSPFFDPVLMVSSTPLHLRSKMKKKLSLSIHCPVLQQNKNLL